MKNPQNFMGLKMTYFMLKFKCYSLLPAFLQVGILFQHMVAVVVVVAVAVRGKGREGREILTKEK